MATLAVDMNRTYELAGDGDSLNDLPVIASDIIYEGAAVGENGSGYMRPLVAGDPFMGFAQRKVDNSTGAAGDLLVKLRTKGRVKLSIDGLAITANDKPPVYASDDDTFTTTAGGNSLIGYVERFVASGIGIVSFDTNLVKTA
jgi:hypothetical protein